MTGRTDRDDRKNVKISKSGNARVSVYTRSEDLTWYPVSIKIINRSTGVFGGMGWGPHCEQLSFRYLCRGVHP